MLAASRLNAFRLVMFDFLEFEREDSN